MGDYSQSNQLEKLSAPFTKNKPLNLFKLVHNSFKTEEGRNGEMSGKMAASKKTLNLG